MEFQDFGKISRLNREIVVTEKIDGTNAQVAIDENTGVIRVGSRTRWITPADDNFGFAAWVYENLTELSKLGPGRHYGEWWGQGIQRNYGLTEKRFSLFNVSRWTDDDLRPKCCGVVPVMFRGIDWAAPARCLDVLAGYGSIAAPGFSNPEGVMVYHIASGHYFKATIKNDSERKGSQKDST